MYKISKYSTRSAQILVIACCLPYRGCILPRIKRGLVVLLLDALQNWHPALVYMLRANKDYISVCEKETLITQALSSHLGLSFGCTGVVKMLAQRSICVRNLDRYTICAFVLRECTHFVL